MTVLEFSIVLFFLAYIAGIFGALTGLGGGVLIIPILVLLFKIDIHYAMGASLISAIATSSGATLSLIKKHYTNLKLAMFLESATIVGAIVGALLVKVVPRDWLAISFGSVLIVSTIFLLKRPEDTKSEEPSHPWAHALDMEDYYQHSLYRIYRVPFGLFLMGIAGLLSGLLGIGSGALKVLSLDVVMKLPYKVSTSTSNFMIGMTAAAGFGVYFSSGYINSDITFPVVLGVLFGSVTGAQILQIANVRMLRIIFSILILFLSIQMIYRGIIGL